MHGHHSIADSLYSYEKNQRVAKNILTDIQQRVVSGNSIVPRRNWPSRFKGMSVFELADRFGCEKANRLHEQLNKLVNVRNVVQTKAASWGVAEKDPAIRLAITQFGCGECEETSYLAALMYIHRTASLDIVALQIGQEENAHFFCVIGDTLGPQIGASLYDYLRNLSEACVILDPSLSVVCQANRMDEEIKALLEQDIGSEITYFHHFSHQHIDLDKVIKLADQLGNSAQPFLPQVARQITLSGDDKFVFSEEENKNAASETLALVKGKVTSLNDIVPRTRVPRRCLYLFEATALFGKQPALLYQEHFEKLKQVRKRVFDAASHLKIDDSDIAIRLAITEQGVGESEETAFFMAVKFMEQHDRKDVMVLCIGKEKKYFLVIIGEVNSPQCGCSIYDYLCTLNDKCILVDAYQNKVCKANTMHEEVKIQLEFDEIDTITQVYNFSLSPISNNLKDKVEKLCDLIKPTPELKEENSQVRNNFI